MNETTNSEKNADTFKKLNDQLETDESDRRLKSRKRSKSHRDRRSVSDSRNSYKKKKKTKKKRKKDYRTNSNENSIIRNYSLNTSKKFTDLESSIRNSSLNLSNEESDVSFSKSIRSLVVPISVKDLPPTEPIQSREASINDEQCLKEKTKSKRHRKSRSSSLELLERSSRHKEKKIKRSRSKDDQEKKIKRSSSHRYSLNYKTGDKSHSFSKYDDLSSKESSILKLESKPRKKHKRDERRSISNDSYKNNYRESKSESQHKKRRSISSENYREAKLETVFRKKNKREERSISTEGSYKNDYKYVRESKASREINKQDRGYKDYQEKSSHQIFKDNKELNHNVVNQSTKEPINSIKKITTPPLPSPSYAAPPSTSTIPPVPYSNTSNSNYPTVGYNQYTQQDYYPYHTYQDPNQLVTPIAQSPLPPLPSQVPLPPYPPPINQPYTENYSNQLYYNQPNHLETGDKYFTQKSDQNNTQSYNGISKNNSYYKEYQSNFNHYNSDYRKFNNENYRSNNFSYRNKKFRKFNDSYNRDNASRYEYRKEKWNDHRYSEENQLNNESGYYNSYDKYRKYNESNYNEYHEQDRYHKYNNEIYQPKSNNLIVTPTENEDPTENEKKSTENLEEDVDKPNDIKSAEDELLTLKNDIHKQLKEKLFDCDKFAGLFEIAGFSDGSESSASSCAENESESINETEIKDIENKKEIKEKRSSKRKTHSSSSESQSNDVTNENSSSIESDESDEGNARIRKSSPSDLLKEKANKNRNKSKRKIKRMKKKSKKADIPSIPEDYEIVRRSVRIKTIEVIKQHHNDLKIAEKIKKHQNHNTENQEEATENQTINSSDEQTTSQQSLKPKYRRLSSLSEASTKTLDTNFSATPPQQQLSIQTNSDLSDSFSAINKNLVVKTNILLHSPCLESPSSLGSSPRAYKKILMNKVVNDPVIQKLTELKSIMPVKGDKFNLNEVLGKDYEPIEENVYRCKKAKQTKFSQEAKKMVCDCSISQQELSLGIMACGDDCLNRLLMIECGSRCPCGDHCTNKNFKTKKNAPIQPFKTELKGWGLKSLSDLKQNTFLIEYIGEVLDLKSFKKRSEKYAKQNNEHFYFMSLHNELFIDATSKGNISRFFNHSCDPNCETQKWTVNGELRIGFFTRRSVSFDEELTFDYQFQTVGKKQQKCYCGSEKCRGFLGVSNNQSNSQSNGALDHIWDDTSDSGSDEDTESSESNEDDSTPNLLKRDSTTLKLKTPEKKLKEKKQKSDRQDQDLNDQINSIKTLSNKESILKLCRLMFRTEDVQSRIDVLNLLLNTKSEMSLRLFMDYHGLKLLWTWMYDIDGTNKSTEQIECKIKIIDVLSTMSIKNRTVLEECKLLDMVKRWANLDDINSQDLSLEPQFFIKEIVDEMLNEILKSPEKEESVCDLELINTLIEKSKELHETWSNLKVNFKIPKKQRIEERKEHERELNQEALKPTSSSAQQNSSIPLSNYEPKFNSFDRSNRDHFMKGTTNRTRSNYSYSNYDRPYNNKSYFPKNNSIHNSNSYSNSYSRYPNQTMTKEQRRELFEQEVKEKEAAALAQAASGQQAQTNSFVEPINEYPPTHIQAPMQWFFDHSIYQWVLIPTQPPLPLETINHVPHPLPQAKNTANNLAQLISSTGSSLIATNLGLTSTAAPNNIKQTETVNEPPDDDDNSLDSKIKKYLSAAVSPTSSTLLIKSGLSPTMDNKISLSTTMNAHAKVKSMEKKQLPVDWKAKKNEKGVTFYYNIKTKKTQLTFPQKHQTPTKPAKSEIESNQTISKSFKTKEKFREKMSKLVINLLKPYLNVDCKVGHIKNNEDFKHLARRFTHTIIEKEIARAADPKEIDIDKRIKQKSHEYISKYMLKFGSSGYSRKNDVI